MHRLVACLLFFTVACPQQRREPGPRQPVAQIANASLRAGFGTVVTLDASSSSDPDGDPLTYRWRLLSGPDAVLRPRGPRVSFTTRKLGQLLPLRPAFGPVAIPRWAEGRYEIELTVSDGRRADTAVAMVRSAGATGGWPRVETGLDLNVYCGESEEASAEWRIDEEPPGSGALVLEANRCLARVRTSRPGRYVLVEAKRRRRLPFWYGDWVGQDECGRPECHARESATWPATKHASVFARAIDGQLGDAYGPQCIGCHVLGSDPVAASPGFARARAKSGWTPPQRPAPGLSATIPAEVRRWTGVQCEQCHGPGRFWTGLSTDVCAQCHDSPPRYTIVSQWRTSSMSIPPTGLKAARADCAGCHTAHGAIGRLRGRPMARPLEEPIAHAVTCAVCHDPHVALHPAQLRRWGEVPFADRSVKAGRGAICMACHGEYAGPERTEEAPHAPQGFVLLEPSSTEPPPHAEVPDLCVGCHMRKPADGGTQAGGHTFSLRRAGDTLHAACTGCHRDARALLARTGHTRRQIAQTIEGLRTRLRSAVSALAVAGCNGSPGSDLDLREQGLVLLDALGRTLVDCGGRPIELPSEAAPLVAAAKLIAIVERDGSWGAHNGPVSRELLEQAGQKLTHNP